MAGLVMLLVFCALIVGVTVYRHYEYKSFLAQLEHDRELWRNHLPPDIAEGMEPPQGAYHREI